MFWDVETSPNIVFSWRTGFKLSISPESIIRERAIICICYKWEGSDRVYSLQWDEGDDRAMIEKFIPIMESADEMVAHNGDKFDVKWFNGRCLKHGFTPPMEPKTVDTLVIARRRFYLNSNRLDYLGHFLFGQGKIRTDFSLWRDIVLDNSVSAMKKMVTYCKEDVRLLERVYNEVGGYHSPKSHAGVMIGLARWTCAHCASENLRRKKRRVTARGTVQHNMLCNDCRRHHTINDKVHRDWIVWKNEQALKAKALEEA
jgi:hypothetical protein